jgi:hypothetical protein
MMRTNTHNGTCCSGPDQEQRERTPEPAAAGATGADEFGPEDMRARWWPVRPLEGEWLDAPEHDGEQKVTPDPALAKTGR